MNKRTEAVREAIARCPASQIELARAAGVPDSTLSRISTGKLGASEDVARRVALALDRWSQKTGELARRIWDTLDDGPEEK